MQTARDLLALAITAYVSRLIDFALLQKAAPFPRQLPLAEIVARAPAADENSRAKVDLQSIEWILQTRSAALEPF